jgi:hypothetical protein
MRCFRRAAMAPRSGAYNAGWTEATLAALIESLPNLTLLLLRQHSFIAGLTGSVKS